MSGIRHQKATGFAYDKRKVFIYEFMNKKNIYIIAAASLLLIGSACLAILSLSREKNDTVSRIGALHQQSDLVASQFQQSIDRSLENASQASGKPEGEPEPVSALSHETGKANPKEITQKQIDRQKIIFVGDSRTVGMGYAEHDKGDGCIYIGASGEGFCWFAETGVALLEETLRENPHLPVVYNFGVNDPESLTDYIDLYRAIEKEWNETVFYYLSVNPIDSDEFTVTNEDILSFNARLKKEFPDTYIESYARMEKEGFETVDGLHYTEEEYCKIHDFVIRSILEKTMDR